MSGERTIRLLITEAAAHGILDQAEYYEQRESRTVAQRWDAAVLRAFRSLTKMPDRGSPCNFSHSELKNLRRMAVPRFPRHLIFYQYLRQESLVRIVHVLHGARDTEALLTQQPPRM
jgi:toxin ParE1/3/4